MRIFLAVSILVASVCMVRAGENWPAWRGPAGTGLTEERNLPLTWSGKTQQNIRWRVPLYPSDKVRRDQNQSSPIVWGERVFVTLSYWPEGVSEKEFPEHHVVCLHAKDGKRLWDAVIPPGPWKLTDLRGGYTAPTPACDGRHVYAVFGSAVIAAVDLQGKIVWRKEINPHSFDVCWGASPILYPPPTASGADARPGTVIVVCDQVGTASTIYAFDGANGDIRWERKRPAAGWAHSTPVLARVGARTQLLTAAHNGPQGLDPATGKILWFFQQSGQVGDTVTPTYRDGLLYVDSGRGGSGIAVDATGAGDISKTPPRWKIPMPEGFSSPLLVGDYLYRLHGPGVLACLKWTTGKEVYKERLEGVDQAVSPIATADGVIYCASAGRTYVVKAGPRFEKLAQNDLGDPCRASPAVAGGCIYLKGGRQLYCIQPGAARIAP